MSLTPKAIASMVESARVSREMIEKHGERHMQIDVKRLALHLGDVEWLAIEIEALRKERDEYRRGLEEITRISGPHNVGRSVAFAALKAGGGGE